jgi:tRNA threonylcarbamoyladenosine modification (KEOPS) complex Cgi121 subunit
MLKQITEYNKYIEITGFRNIKIENTPVFLSALHKLLPEDIEIQFFEADFVASWEHLYFAMVNALTVFKNKRNISKSLAMETVLYASAQRQIKKAIDTIGVKPTTRNVAMVIISENTNSIKAGLSAVVQHLGMQPDETILELSETKIQLLRHAFDISDTELETATGDSDAALVNLVIERVALLSTQI